MFLTLRDEFRFRQILFKLTALKERRRGSGGGAHGMAAAAAVRTGRALRSWDLSKEDFLLACYNITCLHKATKGLGAP